jgi:hypothetical protein
MRRKRDEELTHSEIDIVVAPGARHVEDELEFSLEEWLDFL